MLSATDLCPVRGHFSNNRTKTLRKRGITQPQHVKMTHVWRKDDPRTIPRDAGGARTATRALTRTSSDARGRKGQLERRTYDRSGYRGQDWLLDSRVPASERRGSRECGLLVSPRRPVCGARAARGRMDENRKYASDVVLNL